MTDAHVQRLYDEVDDITENYETVSKLLSTNSYTRDEINEALIMCANAEHGKISC